MLIKYLGNIAEDTDLCAGKIYDVISIEKKWYRIIDSSGEDYLYPPMAFEIIDDSDIDVVMKRSEEIRIAYKTCVEAGYDGVFYMGVKGGKNIWKPHTYGYDPYDPDDEYNVYYYIENGEAKVMTLEEYERL